MWPAQFLPRLSPSPATSSPAPGLSRTMGPFDLVRIMSSAPHSAAPPQASAHPIPAPPLAGRASLPIVAAAAAACSPPIGPLPPPCARCESWLVKKCGELHRAPALALPLTASRLKMWQLESEGAGVSGAQPSQASSVLQSSASRHHHPQPSPSGGLVLVSLWSQCPSVEHPAPASSPLMSDAVASSRLTSSASASSSEQAEQVTSAQGDSAKLHQYAQGLYFVQK